MREAVTTWASTFTETAQIREAAIRTEVSLQATKAELDAYRAQLYLEAHRAQETLQQEHSSCEGSSHAAEPVSNQAVCPHIDIVVFHIRTCTFKLRVQD